MKNVIDLVQAEMDEATLTMSKEQWEREEGQLSAYGYEEAKRYAKAGKAGHCGPMLKAFSLKAKARASAASAGR